MNFLLGVIGMILSYFMIRKREMIGDMIGDAEWMQSIGGIYYVIVYSALLIFMYSFAMMFGLTEGIFETILRPIMPWVFESNDMPL